VEWLYHQAMFRDYGEARSEIARMIDFYNNVRPPHEHRQQEAARRMGFPWHEQKL